MTHHQAPAAVPRALDPDELLVRSTRKRMIVRHLRSRSGASILHLSYGDTEIVFDEPGTFRFGRALARHGEFRAGDAAAWGCDWTTAKALLEQLVAENILHRAGRCVALDPVGRSSARLRIVRSTLSICARR
jgi:hypothetical protein